MKRERIDKILSNLGYGSRKQIKKIMKTGVLTIDEEVIKDPSVKIFPQKKNIRLKGEKIEYKEFIYFMLNKPSGYISATEDNYENTVLDLINEEDKFFKIFPIGRLDKDTEGLLVLSNDGQKAHRVLSPKNKIKKKYYAKIQGFVDQEDIDILKLGVVLNDGYKTLPASLKVIKTANVSEVELDIVEGKYHQVKRMFEALDKEVIYLKRIKMGKLELDKNLMPGDYRELTEKEVEDIEKND